MPGNTDAANHFEDAPVFICTAVCKLKTNDKLACSQPIMKEEIFLGLNLMTSHLITYHFKSKLAHIGQMQIKIVLNLLEKQNNKRAAISFKRELTKSPSSEL